MEKTKPKLANTSADGEILEINMKDLFADYTNWYNRVLTEWFTFFGQIAVCCALYYFIIYLLKENGFKPSKTMRIILGLIITIIIFAPVLDF